MQQTARRDLCREYFDTNCTILYEGHGHVGYLVNDYQSIQDQCSKWLGNREPDSQRILEMVKHFNSGGYVPLFFHLAQTPGGLVCYDGNHRRECFKTLNASVPVMVDIMFGVTDTEVNEAFRLVNSAVQLPSLYIERPPHTKDLQRLVQYYCRRWPHFLSPSPHPRAPHFNKDVLLQDLDDIYRSFGGQISVDILGECLDRLNIMYTNDSQLPSRALLTGNYTEVSIKKCCDHGFFLFIGGRIPTRDVHLARNTL